MLSRNIGLIVIVCLLILAVGCENYESNSNSQVDTTTTTKQITIAKINPAIEEENRNYNYLYVNHWFNYNEKLKVELIDFDTELNSFVNWMEQKGYDKKIIDVYVEESKDPDLRWELGEFFFNRHVYGVEDENQIQGIYVSKHSSPKPDTRDFTFSGRPAQYT